MNDDQTATVGMLERSVSRMPDLINDAMDLTRGRLGGGIALGAESDAPVEMVLRHVIDEVRSRWLEWEKEALFRLTSVSLSSDVPRPL